MRIKIIGCGTSGLAYGITSLKQGNKVDIYEKRNGLKEKACGGICPYKTMELLRELNTNIDKECDWIEYKTFGVYDYTKEKEIKRVIEVPIKNEIKRADKHEILQSLRKEFLRLGGNIIWSSLQPIKNDDKYDMTINCSGANVGQKGLGFAIESEEFEYDNEKGYNDASVLYDHDIDGYYWVMKCEENKWNVGMIGEKNFAQYNKLIREFALKTIGKNDFVYNGAYTTYKYNSDKTNDIINIGESAGLTTPIGFEGIYRSLKCGIDMAKKGNYDYKGDKRDNAIGNFMSKIIYRCVGKVEILSKIFNKGNKKFDDIVNNRLCFDGHYYIK